MREDARFLAEIPCLDVFGLVEDDPPDLRADDIFASRPVREDLAHPQLGEAGAVERSVVEVTDAVVPRRVDRRERLRLGDVAKHVAERCRAEA